MSFKKERDKNRKTERERLSGRLVEEDAAFDCLAADGALAHSVPTQLTGAMAAHEDHVLQPVETHRTHGLQRDEEKSSEYIRCCDKAIATFYKNTKNH